MPSLPSVFTVLLEARKQLRDFFSSHIQNPNSRRPYRETVPAVLRLLCPHGIEELGQVKPVDVAAFVEDQLWEHSRSTVKQRLAALRMLFDWMVVGQILSVTRPMRCEGRSTASRRASRPVLNVDEARTMIDAIDTTSLT